MLHLQAQQARYSTADVGEAVKIAGKWGNAIHAWSTPGPILTSSVSGSTIVTLHIFSDEMKLLNERTISLGKTSFSALDFQLADSFYYARIIYGFPALKKMILKIDPSGNIEDLSSIPGIWTSRAIPEDVQHLGQFTHNKTSLFTVQTETVTAGSMPDTTNMIAAISNETGKNGTIQQIVIKKASRKTGQLIAKRWYTAGQLDFSALLVSATDSNLTVSGFVQSGAAAARQNNGKKGYLFLARLDTSLAEQTHALLEVSAAKGDETYVLKNMYLLNNHLLLTGSGMRSQTSFTYGVADKDGMPSIPQEHNYYIAASTRIAVLDSKNNLLLDTIFNSTPDPEHLPSENIFVANSDSAADIFCMHQYSRNKKGITHFSIKKSGVITEREMIVNESYQYRLGNAEMLEDGILFIPYRYKNKNGLMKLVYEPAKQAGAGG